MKFQNQVNSTAVVLLFALLIRICIALAFPNIVAPDEVFQFYEQAHRLVFGHGIVPWEYQVGLRCWLIPFFLAALMEVAHLVLQNPLAGLILIRLVLCVASLSIVWCAARWGKRFYGQPGVWIAGGFAAVWPDLWLMAPHVLEEILAADVLVPAIYLVESPATRTSLRRIACAGFLLGLAFTLRVQLAPAIALAGIALCRRDLRSWRVALLAAALPFLTAGMLDWATWGQPFRSFWLNIYLNVFLGVAKGFGTPPPTYFIFMLGLDWLWTLPVMALLVWRGAKLVPIAGIVVLTIIVTHSMISHKEYRFIFPAIALAVPIAGLGLSWLWADFRNRVPVNTPRLCFGVFLLLGPLFSPWVYFNLQWQTDSFWAFDSVSKLPVSLVSVEGLQRMFTSDEPAYFPIDLMFPASTSLTRQTVVTGPSGTTVAGAIVSVEHTVQIPPAFHLLSCYKGIWIPFSKSAAPRLCTWASPPGTNSTGPALPFEFPFPAIAKPFIVKDRLFAGE
jgi:hypothetical protein